MSDDLDIPAFLRSNPPKLTTEVSPVSVLHQFVQEVEAAVDGDNVVAFRNAGAIRINALADKFAETGWAIGQELVAMRDTFAVVPGQGAVHTRPGWEDWVKANLKFGYKHAVRLIHTYEKFGVEQQHLGNASMFLLDFLARDSVPEEGRAEVIRRLHDGETIGKRTAEKIVDEYRPTASEAREIARETGKPTAARDGKIYLGATKEQEQEAEDRRTIVYGIRRAVDTLAEMQMSGEEFIAYAFKHQLWKPEEEHVITEAYEWLTDLVAAWERR